LVKLQVQSFVRRAKKSDAVSGARSLK